MPDVEISESFLILYSPTLGVRTLLNPLAVKVYLSLYVAERTLSDVAVLLGLPLTTVQAIVKKMHNLGIVMRLESQDDARKVLYHPCLNILLKDNNSGSPFIDSWCRRNLTCAVDSELSRKYREFTSRGIDFYYSLDYIGAIIGDSTPELIDKGAFNSSTSITDADPVFDLGAKVDVDYTGSLRIKARYRNDVSLSDVLLMATFSSALMRHIRNETDIHFEYSAEISLRAQERLLSFTFKKYRSHVGVFTPCFSADKYCDPTYWIKSVIYVVGGRSVIVQNPLMLAILDELEMKDCSLSHLVESLDKSKASVTPSLAKLQKFGLIRVRDPLVRRNREYSLNGRKLMEIDPAKGTRVNEEIEYGYWHGCIGSDLGKCVSDGLDHVFEQSGISSFYGSLGVSETSGCTSSPASPGSK